MASTSKQPDTKSPGCLGAAFIGLLILGFLALGIYFHPFGPYWKRRAEAAEAARQAAKQAALLGEARETANLFLDALKNDDGGSAYSLLSGAYRGRLSLQERFLNKMNVPVVGGQRPTEWKLGAGKLSGDKATFSGSVRSKDLEDHSYRLVMVKEGGFWAPGSWRVDLFTVQP
jgi:hypothetical protein